MGATASTPWCDSTSLRRRAGTSTSVEVFGVRSPRAGEGFDKRCTLFVRAVGRVRRSPIPRTAVARYAVENIDVPGRFDDPMKSWIPRRPARQPRREGGRRSRVPRCAHAVSVDGGH
jgi:hypothetical protein